MTEIPELSAREQFITCGSKKLRCGITTGSCAAIAAMAATEAIFSKVFPEYSKIVTPKGWIAASEILDGKFFSETKAGCAVQKDSGDDSDVTNGIFIYSVVEVFPDSGSDGTIFGSGFVNNGKNGRKCDRESRQKKVQFCLAGGRGVGKITKPGLDQNVGEAAINSVPRKMIEESVLKVAENYGFNGKILVTVEVPEGEEIARKTFNPMLGIEGGISILGTSGVVEPMSETALVDSIEVEMRVISEIYKQKNAKVRPLIITPGNYGEDFLKNYPELSEIPEVKCSNFIGNALDFASLYEFTHVLFVGHAGKFVKLAGGIMNTHSKIADCRVELIAAHAALCGAEQFDIARIFDAATVDAALEILDESNLAEKVMKSLIRAAQKKVARRIDGKYKFALATFTNERGLLGTTANFDAITGEFLSCHSY